MLVVPLRRLLARLEVRVGPRGLAVVTHTPIRVHTLILEVLIVAGGLFFLWRAAHEAGWWD